MEIWRNLVLLLLITAVIVMTDVAFCEYQKRIKYLENENAACEKYIKFLNETYRDIDVNNIRLHGKIYIVPKGGK